MPPSRVVSLCPSITETIVAIGGFRLLAGVTRYCTRPKGMLWGLPRVGGTKSPRMDDVAALEPDLVLANQEENTRGALEINFGFVFTRSTVCTLQTTSPFFASSDNRRPSLVPT